jgi:hypothetical protein
MENLISCLEANKPRVYYRTKQLMLCREIIAVCSWDPHKTHKYTVGQNVEFVSVTQDGTYINHLSLKGLIQLALPFTPRDTVVFPVSKSINKNMNVKRNSNRSLKLKIPLWRKTADGQFRFWSHLKVLWLPYGARRCCRGVMCPWARCPRRFGRNCKG